MTGVAGQDGYYLVRQLLAEGAIVHATVRDRSRAADVEALPGAGWLTLHELDAADADGYGRLVAGVQPDEFYNFVGQSSVARSFRDPTDTWRSNADAVQGMLEAIRLHSPTTRFYQSSSTDMFGSLPGRTVIHDEASPFLPHSPYAAAKAAAHVLCDAYRSAFDLRIACGILSNHESRRRPASFLTQKVTEYVRVARDAPHDEPALRAPLRVGNLAAQREWGYAPDYVDGVIRICRQIAVRAGLSGSEPEPDVGSNYRDYVLGSGRLHAVWEVIDRAFALGGLPLEWDRTSTDSAAWSARLKRTGSVAVVVDPSLIRRSDPAAIGTDPSRARDELDWRPHADLDHFLVDMLSDVALGKSATARG